MKIRKKKKKNKGISVKSSRGRRRSDKIETTGSVFKIVGFILMIVFYVVMIYSVFHYRTEIDSLLDQYNNGTLPSVINAINRNLLTIIGVV